MPVASALVDATPTLICLGRIEAALGRRSCSTPLSKLKLLTLDPVEYKKDRTKILDQMTAIFGGEWGS